jgi:type III secretion system YscD/HrpQ family protein
MGHILTGVEYQEMLYLLKAKPFIKNIDDNVIIEEYVFENMNALLYKNPVWRSVILTGSQPGKFVLKGYLQTLDEFSSLNDYVNRNFPYLDKLKIEVVVENNVQTSVQALLAQRGFNGVTFQFANGEIVLSGRIEQGQEKVYNSLLKELDQIPGIRHIKNFVVFTTHSSARLDVSSRFKVTGTSKLGDLNQFILINGKILSTGDLLEGMVITAINPTSVFLEKEGIKYKIDYNLQ